MKSGESKTIKPQEHKELTIPNHQAKLNWLRAGVLGANDGIVSIAGLVVGVAGATTSVGIIFAAGIPGIIAGSISMAAGEYVSVSSSRDTEKALLDKERYELAHHPQEELEELAYLYTQKGLNEKTAMQVAKELTKHDAIAAHFDAELKIDPENLMNPWHAAFASAVSFFVGAVIPLIAIVLPPDFLRIPIAFSSVLVALIITGVVSAKIGKTNVWRATVRVILGGVLAMSITYAIGSFFGVHGL
jgi:VIT1/CCC1 family predicted Fe2+/Mn2+ transporter